jgi:hypothetical protein
MGNLFLSPIKETMIAPPDKKNPSTLVEGLRGSYWIRTSDLFHVKEAL